MALEHLMSKEDRLLLAELQANVKIMFAKNRLAALNEYREYYNEEDAFHVNWALKWMTEGANEILGDGEFELSTLKNDPEFILDTEVPFWYSIRGNI
jgi:hypothetical protein